MRPAVPRLALALALAGAGATWAYDPAMVPEPPAPGRFVVTVREGSRPGWPSTNYRTLAQHVRGHLFLHLSPPLRGRYGTIPHLAASRSGKEVSVFEVPARRHAPWLPPRGWADLGPVPEEGEYDVRVDVGDAGVRYLKLTLTEDQATLALGDGEGALGVSLPVQQRLPAGSFTYRFDHYHGHYNRVMVRRLWAQVVRNLDGVSELSRPSGPLTDEVFSEMLHGGSAPLFAVDPSRVAAGLIEMARETDANIVVRWYGGATWDLRDIRRGVYPWPHWLPNLSYVLSHGRRLSDTFSPEAPHARPHPRGLPTTFMARYWGEGPASPMPHRGRRTSLFSPDQPSGSSRPDADLEAGLEDGLDDDLGDELGGDLGDLDSDL